MVKYFNIVIVFYLIFYFFAVHAAEADDVKDCNYCIQYKKLLDWPVENRPNIFVYQEDIQYPEGMFGDENKMKRAGEKVGYRFVKKKKSLGKHPGPMIMDMAYFEVLFNEMLNDRLTKVEKIEKLLKVRTAFRQSLNISPNAPAEEAILKFYSLGKMMRAAKRKNKKLIKI